MSYADAADAVNCAISTVRSRLHRAHNNAEQEAAAFGGGGPNLGYDGEKVMS